MASNEEEKIIVEIQVLATRMLIEDWQVDPRLKQFGVVKSELTAIVRGVVAARADASPDDPASAEGQFAYIYGTRLIRQLFRSKRWLKHREDNVESVKHPDVNLRIIYQSVDRAGDIRHKPKAVSAKGSGSDRLIAAGQEDLFPTEIERVDAKLLDDLKAGTWFFCVSVDGDDVRAELSLPSGVAGGNFDDFIERIFIVREGEWLSIKLEDDSDATEIEPKISRK